MQNNMTVCAKSQKRNKQTNKKHTALHRDLGQLQKLGFCRKIEKKCMLRDLYK